MPENSDPTVSGAFTPQPDSRWRRTATASTACVPPSSLLLDCGFVKPQVDRKLLCLPLGQPPDGPRVSHVDQSQQPADTQGAALREPLKDHVDSRSREPLGARHDQSGEPLASLLGGECSKLLAAPAAAQPDLLRSLHRPVTLSGGAHDLTRDALVV